MKLDDADADNLKMAQYHPIYRTDRYVVLQNYILY